MFPLYNKYFGKYFFIFLIQNLAPKDLSLSNTLVFPLKFNLILTMVATGNIGESKESKASLGNSLLSVKTIVIRDIKIVM